MWKFSPIFKHTLWGGDAITSFKNMPAGGNDIGESWEISAIPGNTSIVCEGPDKDSSLYELLSRYKDNLLGKHNWKKFGTRFPLLIKFIDAHKDLSLQVHPHDRHVADSGEPNGKDEMWYVISAEPGARIASGFNRLISKEKLKELCASGEILDYTNLVTAHPGMVLYVPGGRIHAIGKGVFLAEIQQTANTTYRVHDYNRRDKNGNFRELHLDKALSVIDLNDTSTGVVEPDEENHADSDEVKHLLHKPPFSVSLIDHDSSDRKELSINCAALDSFVILTAVAGAATISCRRGECKLLAGESLLLAADEQNVVVKTDGIFKSLMIHIPE